MNEEILKRIDAIAEKLGITAEFLWDALLRQAPISASVKLSGIAVGFALIYAVYRHIGKHHSTREDYGFVLLVATHMVSFALVLFTAASASDIVAGFINPEYWALKQLLK